MREDAPAELQPTNDDAEPNEEECERVQRIRQVACADLSNDEAEAYSYDLSDESSNGEATSRCWSSLMYTTT